MQSLEPWSWIAGIGSFFVSLAALLVAARQAWPTFVAQRAERRRRQRPELLWDVPPAKTSIPFAPYLVNEKRPSRWARTRNRLRGGVLDIFVRSRIFRDVLPWLYVRLRVYALSDSCAIRMANRTTFGVW